MEFDLIFEHGKFILLNSNYFEKEDRIVPRCCKGPSVFSDLRMYNKNVAVCFASHLVF